MNDYIDAVSRKLPKEKVHYTDRGHDKAHCGICVHFIKPRFCEIVRGTIKEGGWCQRFANQL